MRVFMKKLRVETENEKRVFLESLNFEIEMRVSQKSEMQGFVQIKLKFNWNVEAKLIAKTMRLCPERQAFFPMFSNNLGLKQFHVPKTLTVALPSFRWSGLPNSTGEL